MAHYGFCHFCGAEGNDLPTTLTECGDCGAYCVEICSRCRKNGALCPSMENEAGTVGDTSQVELAS